MKLIIYSDFKIIKIKLESMVRCMERENVLKYHENNVSKPGEKILMVLNWLNFLYPNYDYQFSLMDCLIACCFLLISALMWPGHVSVRFSVFLVAFSSLYQQMVSLRSKMDLLQWFSVFQPAHINKVKASKSFSLTNTYRSILFKWLIKTSRKHFNVQYN